jgi:hypothetical protein
VPQSNTSTTSISAIGFKGLSRLDLRKSRANRKTLPHFCRLPAVDIGIHKANCKSFGDLDQIRAANVATDNSGSQCHRGKFILRIGILNGRLSNIIVEGSTEASESGAGSAVPAAA